MRIRSHLLVTFKDDKGAVFPAKSVELTLGPLKGFPFTIKIPQGSLYTIKIPPDKEIELLTAGQGMLSFTSDHHHTYRFRVKVTKNKQKFLMLDFDDTSVDMLDKPRMATSSVSSSGLTTQTLIEFKVGKCKEVLLVTGHNYKPHSQNFPYRRYAYTRMHDLAHEGHFDNRNEARTNMFNKEFVGKFPLDDSTVITHFDFQTGQRSHWVRGNSGRDQLARGSKAVKERDPDTMELIKDDMWAVGGGWCRIGLENVGTKPPKLELDKPRNRPSVDPGKNAISITHIYKYIQKIGDERPGSLVEFGLYSHAGHTGPIMFNTNERKQYKDGGEKEDERDEEDHDGRFWKDFSPPNMTLSEKDNFQKAFSSDAFIKLYGCYATEGIRRKIKLARKVRDAATKKTRNEDIINNFYKWSYPFFLSKAIGHPVWNGAPGTSADRLEGHEWFLWPYVSEYLAKWEYNENRRKARKDGIDPVALRPGKRVLKKKSKYLYNELHYYKDTLGGTLSWDWYLKYDAANPLTP